MCDAVAGNVGKQSPVDKDSSEAGADSNRDSGYGPSTTARDSGYGPSTSNQQSVTMTDSSSREYFSGENSQRSSGSETSSSLGQHRKGRLGLAPGAAKPQSPSARSSDKPSSQTTASGAVDSGVVSEDKSAKDACQAALQKEAYNHVMTYVRKIVEWEKDSQESPASPPEKEEEPGGAGSAESGEPPARLEVLVSLRKGTVVETSSSLTELLGYPTDMWAGRSFIDYVYPKDRVSFTRSISSMGVDMDGGLVGKDWSGTCQLYCRLRHHRGLKSVGFNVVSRTHIYRPFQMRVIFREDKTELNGEGPCILVVAEILHSAYQNAAGEFDGVDQLFRSMIFSMRHTASCVVDQYDTQGITLLGHLPQDMIGRSIVDFFHPDDLPAIKEVYRRVPPWKQLLS